LADLRFFGYLSDLVGTRIKEVRLEHSVTLRELVPPSFPEANIVILINQRAGTLDSRITDQDSVVFMPFLSGG
jgi:molybdopterin converting factor small subunit